MLQLFDIKLSELLIKENIANAIKCQRKKKRGQFSEQGIFIVQTCFETRAAG